MVLFNIITLVVSGGSIVALFMLLPNDMQSRITKHDTFGWYMALLGAMIFTLGMLFTTNVFDPHWGVQDLSTAFGLMFSNLAALPLAMGITIGLDDKITDPFLDQKNIWKLALVLAGILAIFSLILG